MLEPGVRLRQSIIDGNLLVVKRLLKRFPDLLENIDPTNGWSSLHYAAFNGRYLVCVYLIGLGHDRNEISKTFKQDTSVHLSLMNGHEQTTHLLLQHFKNQLNIKGENGYAPLHISSIKDYFKCVEMLLGLGADINAIDDEGNNALHICMKYNSLNSMRILIRANIDTHYKNKAGLKPVDVASSFETESYYNNLLQDPSFTTDETLVTPTMNPIVPFEEASPVSLSISKRAHSTSLPPLPSVTTTRRPSNSSSSKSIKSPIPRSAISLEFNGSHSNSYIYTPSQSMSQQKQQVALSGLTIKPPTLGITKSSSPVLYTPTTPTIFPSTTNTLNLQHSSSFNGVSIREGFKTHRSSSGNLTSFPSMSSLNSGNFVERKTTPTENRTRTNSSINSTTTPQSINFVSINKTRSNSGGENKSEYGINNRLNLPARKPPSRASHSPSNTPAHSLSRSSTNNSAMTVSTDSENEYTLQKKPTGSNSNSEIFDNDTFDNNRSLKKKISTKFESVTSTYRKRTSPSSSNSPISSTHSSRRNSILNIHISSLGRRKEE